MREAVQVAVWVSEYHRKRWAEEPKVGGERTRVKEPSALGTLIFQCDRTVTERYRFATDLRAGGG